MISYLEQVSPTYLENWPQEIKSLSVAQIDIPLSLEEANTLGASITDWFEAFSTPTTSIDDIRKRVSDAVERFPRGAFVRLGSRSPKDSWLAMREGSMKVQRGEDPLRFILDASERVYEDLSLAIQENYPPHIFVREWKDIPAWSEFRCFMANRNLVGISQYQYRDYFQEVVNDKGAIEWCIREFFRGFRRQCHIPDVVFDVFVIRKEHGNDCAWEVKLLELNPSFEMTDPCLFDWSKEFDGSFRIVEESLARRGK